MRAALHNDLPGVLRLIQLGAPLDRVSTMFIGSALFWACFEGHAEVALALLDGKFKGAGADADLPTVGVLGTTPLMQACQKGLTSVVARMLKLGVRLTTRDMGGSTALGHAFHPPTRAILLAAGATL